MADATSPPSARPRKILTDIAAATWEHPADRAALQSLRAIPGFDMAVKKIIGFLGERGIRLMFQANAVRVGPNQFPTLHSLMSEAKITLDYDEEVPLFVSQTPLVNAGAYGVDQPFIVLNSGAVDLLNDDEARALIGHEIGHVMSGHSLYRTILYILLAVGIRNLPFLAGIALLPIRLALQEWSRKSELSADRAGLLTSQDRDETLGLYLKLAGGGMTTADQISLPPYMEQAKEYEDYGGLDAIYKILNMLDASHPFHTLRAAELNRWHADGDYTKIMAGDYIRRSDASTHRPLSEDLGDGASYYAKEAKEAVGQVADAAKRAAQAFADAFKDNRE